MNLKQFLSICLLIILLFVLSILSQTGGLVLLICLLISLLFKKGALLKSVLLFFGLYMLSTLLLIPALAPAFGREKLNQNEQTCFSSGFIPLLNRNYVTPELNTLIRKVSADMEEYGIKLIYLDANFPFLDGFPLLPHRSHDDGKKLDLAFVYEDENGHYNEEAMSRSGYGIFEEAKAGEFDQVRDCIDKGNWQYGLTANLHFGKKKTNMKFSEKGTALLINSLLRHGAKKIFIEPHLKKRMNLVDSRIRFHGCAAVRHDDHIHLQL